MKYLYSFIQALKEPEEMKRWDSGYLIPKVTQPVRVKWEFGPGCCPDFIKKSLFNTLLNNQQITEEIKKETKIFIETNENEDTTTQNLWDTVNALLRGKFIAIQAYLNKQEKSQINNLTLHLKQLEKEEMKNPRVSRRKEILKIRAEINAKDTKRP